MKSLGIWLVRPEAERLGEVLSESLSGELVRPWQQPQNRPKTLFENQFFQYRAWVLVMTTGIAVRYLQGLPKDKHTDPAVVVVDEGGRYAISLLSGHEGGANQLTYRVANAIQATPVITTATETHKSLILGIGCRKGVSLEQIDQTIHAGLSKVNRSLQDVRKLATIDLKGDEPALIQWSQNHQIPLQTLPQSLLAERPWVTQPSEWVYQNIGVVGVCEPCALLASDRGTLILEKMALNGVTIAIVEDPSF